MGERRASNSEVSQSRQLPGRGDDGDGQGETPPHDSGPRQVVGGGVDYVVTIILFKKKITDHENNSKEFKTFSNKKTENLFLIFMFFFMFMRSVIFL